MGCTVRMIYHKMLRRHKTYTTGGTAADHDDTGRWGWLLHDYLRRSLLVHDYLGRSLLLHDHLGWRWLLH